MNMTILDIVPANLPSFSNDQRGQVLPQSRYFCECTRAFFYFFQPTVRNYLRLWKRPSKSYTEFLKGQSCFAKVMSASVEPLAWTRCTCSLRCVLEGRTTRSCGTLFLFFSLCIAMDHLRAILSNPSVVTREVRWNRFCQNFFIYTRKCEHKIVRWKHAGNRGRAVR